MGAAKAERAARRLGELGNGLRLALKPAGEVQQVIGVGAQRAGRQLTSMLSIQKIIDPGDLMILLIEHAIGTSASLGGSWRGHDQFHNCCARSRQSLNSAAVAPATK